MEEEEEMLQELEYKSGSADEQVEDKGDYGILHTNIIMSITPRSRTLKVTSTWDKDTHQRQKQRQ